MAVSHAPHGTPLLCPETPISAGCGPRATRQILGLQPQLVSEVYYTHRPPLRPLGLALPAVLRPTTHRSRDRCTFIERDSIWPDSELRTHQMWTDRDGQSMKSSMVKISHVEPVDAVCSWMLNSSLPPAMAWGLTQMVVPACVWTCV